MDPLTAFVIAILMMLLNGAVLGMIHRDLPEALRPAAFSWRIGTLLIAAGCVLLMVQQQLPMGLVLPLANGAVLLGLTAYWRALRQFDGRPDRAWVLAPMLIGTAGITWFATAMPDLQVRVLIASATWVGIFVGCVRELRADGGHKRVSSRHALIGIYLVLTVFMLMRAYVFATPPDGVSDILDAHFWMNMATPIVAAILPVIGTTAFLLMCSERIRRDWEHAASTDALTGLANRRTITRIGGERLKQAQSQQGTLALALIDIDHFKSVNDRFGHEVGDLALRHVADAIRAACATEALPGRQGGEEFVVLFDPGSESTQAAGERLRNEVRSRPFRKDDIELTVTVSIGITSAVAADRSLDDLLRRADRALYTAKSTGRDRVVMA